MNQAPLQSLIEALFNVAIGLCISVIYTVISIARQYTLHRWFNARLQRAAAALARRAS